MDALHESHLERILENRRRRGVLGSVPPQDISSHNKKPPRDTPQMVDSFTSPIVPERATGLDHCAADQAHSAARLRDQTVAGPDELFQSTADSRIRSSNNENSINNSNKNGYGGTRKGNGDYGLRWGNSGNREDGHSPPTALYRGRNGQDVGASWRSSHRTIPLLTYSSSDASLRSASCLRRESCTSPNRSFRYDIPPVWFRNPSRSRDTSWGRNPSRSRDTSWGRNPSRSRDTSWGRNPSRSRDPSWGRDGRGGRGGREEESGGRASVPPWRSRANDGHHVFPDESRNPPAGSVIYGGEGQPYAASPPRRPSAPPLPHISEHQQQQEHRWQSKSNNCGLANTHTTMNIRTSVSILAGGDWFYKWNLQGTSVSPRWVWIDTQSYLLLWSHKETRESTFAGTIKLEKILHVSARELKQTGENGVPHTYYILLLETAKRVLQLGTERRMKADAWYEALNNVLLYIRSQNFRVPV